MGSVLSWKGLLASERPRVRVLVWLALLVVSTSTSFLQLGFVLIAPFGVRLCYAMGLLAPIATTSLLLGAPLGALVGLLSAIGMCIHAILEPLDIVEKCLVLTAPPAFVALYALVGLVFGLLSAVALRTRAGNEPQGVRRIVALAAACLVPALLASVIFSGSVRIGPFDSVLTGAELGSPVAQAVCDIALMVGTTLAFDAIVRKWYEYRPYMSVRTVVRSQMLIVLAVVFIAALAACFVAITRADRNDAWRTMRSTLTYMCNQNAEPDAVESFPQEQGTLIVIEDGVVTCSNNPAYPENETLQTALGEDGAPFVASLAQSGSMVQTLQDGTSGLTELAYACAQTTDDGRQIVMQTPFSTVFDHRRETMAGSSLVALSMLAVTLALGSLLIRKVIIDPIDRVNASLGRIVSGDLDELASETNSVEFASLSAQINETVDALKQWIGEAERRIESELAAARAIQESALPKELQDLGTLDLYASMVPAREVGGDFYDYYYVDDHTLGFCIADVSGKGIPAALYMMRAKNELASCMQSGLPLADAIALANAHLSEGNDALTFVTVWAGMLDLHTGTLTFVNAGHNEPLLLRKGRWEWLRDSDGPLMGFSDLATYQSRTLMLEAGDMLLLFTDGVTEAMNTQRKLYGEKRLKALVDEHVDSAPRDLDDAVRADLAAWAADADQSDDITILTVRMR